MSKLQADKLHQLRKIYAPLINNLFDNIDYKELNNTYKKHKDEIILTIIALFNSMPDSPSRADLFKYNRYKKLTSKLKNIIGKLGLEEIKLLNSAIKGITNDHNALWNNTHYSNRIKNNKNAMLNTILDKVAFGLNLNKNLNEITKDIKVTVDTNLNKAISLANTEIIAYNNMALIEQYKKDNIKEVVWISVKDEKVCPICTDLDGTIFNIDEAPIQAHPNCRCILSVVDEDLKELTEYQKVLGEEAPKTLKEFKDMKYNDSDKWNNLKEYYKYKIDNPSSDKNYFKINNELSLLKEQGLINKEIGTAVKPEIISYKSIHKHALNRMKKRNVSEDEAKGYMYNARIMFKQSNGDKFAYYSNDGSSTIVKSEELMVTVFPKSWFDDGANKILEVLDRYGV